MLVLSSPNFFLVMCKCIFGLVVLHFYPTKPFLFFFVLCYKKHFLLFNPLVPTT